VPSLTTQAAAYNIAWMTAANNPFVRLKHYRPDECDPKENHATESLAACLRLSLSLRSAFLRLCHNGTLPLDELLIPDVDVVTQEPLGSGVLDLYLSMPKRYHLGIEVKVAAREDDRHRDQAIAYSQWLQQQEPPGTLLSLVKTRDPQFNYGLCGIANRMTWRNVYECFTAQALTALGTDSELARAFCGYLVNEGIVMDYDIKSLVRFADGVRAQTALEATFTQVADDLAAHGFETNLRMMKRDQWPRLEVKSKEWSAIFGEGQNYRIYLWYQVPGIWNAKEHEFWLTVEVYNQEYPSDWARIKPRLESWFKALRDEGLTYDVFIKNWNQCVTGLAANKITSVPVRITAYSMQPLVSQAKIEQLGPDALVESLVAGLRKFAAIIDRLR
jgi:hypothetical protein